MNCIVFNFTNVLLYILKVKKIESYPVVSSVDFTNSYFNIGSKNPSKMTLHILNFNCNFFREDYLNDKASLSSLHTLAYLKDHQ